MSLTNEDKKWIIETMMEGIPPLVKPLIEEAKLDTIRILKSYMDSEISGLKDQMKDLVTKEEFYAVTDKILTSISKIELEIMSHKSALSDHESRIDILEKFKRNISKNS